VFECQERTKEIVWNILPNQRNLFYSSTFSHYSTCGGKHISRLLFHFPTVFIPAQKIVVSSHPKVKIKHLSPSCRLMSAYLVFNFFFFPFLNIITALPLLYHLFSTCSTHLNIPLISDFYPVFRRFPFNLRELAIV